MKSIKENRFIIWLMLAPVFWCMGAIGFIAWILVNVAMFSKEEKEYENSKIPWKERPEIKALNDPSTFNDFDREIKAQYPNAVKVWEGGWSIYNNEDK